MASRSAPDSRNRPCFRRAPQASSERVSLLPPFDGPQSHRVRTPGLPEVQPVLCTCRKAWQVVFGSNQHCKKSNADERSVPEERSGAPEASSFLILRNEGIGSPEACPDLFRRSMSSDAPNRAMSFCAPCAPLYLLQPPEEAKRWLIGPSSRIRTSRQKTFELWVYYTRAFANGDRQPGRLWFELVHALVSW